ncbi:BDN_1c_G0007970.mRNA.1.CDS.1 [Saccharomyces cerevisiae]|nr:BDN_1c_G0007970.mRNA.1.CDS.1 [Saccharomyces cerevisiae]CAI7065738.1 BDN_1c_G0007970.mRNA.1.CDS.1 [Saccharomyces cerevisiae]
MTNSAMTRAALSVRIYRRAVPAADLRKIGSPFVAISCNLKKHSLKKYWCYKNPAAYKYFRFYHTAGKGLENNLKIEEVKIVK